MCCPISSAAYGIAPCAGAGIRFAATRNGLHGDRYSECIDSFFAFGLFESAKRSGFFPKALVDTFEPVMQEEARHILFFVNWAAWHRRTIPLWRRPFFELKCWPSGCFSSELLHCPRRGNGVQDNNFTMTGRSQSATISTWPI